MATVSAATATSLTVSVPADAKRGKISVMVGTAADTSEMSFRVLDPNVLAITGINPTSAAAGTSVTISGQNFSTTAAENTVTFLGDINDNIDNQRATVSAATAISLTVSVPTDAQTGKISVMVGTAADTSDASFTVTAPAAPVVSSFSPSEGAVGTSVTITGENFSTTPSENEVEFGGVMAAAPTSASTTSLTILVPSGARTGRIYVAVGGQTGTSSTNFTVTGTTPVSPFSVPLSSEGDVRLYPNPTSGHLHFTSKLNTGTSYKIYALVGKRVLSGTLQDDNTIDVRSLPDGQYVLTLENKKNTEVLRTRVLILK